MVNGALLHRAPREDQINDSDAEPVHGDIHWLGVSRPSLFKEGRRKLEAVCGFHADENQHTPSFWHDDSVGQRPTRLPPQCLTSFLLIYNTPPSVTRSVLITVRPLSPLQVITLDHQLSCPHPHPVDDGMGEKEIVSQVRQYLPSSRQSRVEDDPQQSTGNPRFVPQLLSDQWEWGETWENLERKAMTEQQEKLRQQAQVNSQFMGAEPATGLKYSPLTEHCIPEMSSAWDSSPCTMILAVAWTDPSVLLALQLYWPWSEKVTFWMKSPPELVIAKRESCGKGEPVPRVQLMRGWGCPETPHSKVTLSPISTSVFCGWITKVGLAGRKRVLQKSAALLPAQLWAEIAGTPHTTQLAITWLFPDLQILTMSNSPSATSSYHLLPPSHLALEHPHSRVPFSFDTSGLQNSSQPPDSFPSPKFPLNPQIPTPVKEPPKVQTTLRC